MIIIKCLSNIPTSKIFLSKKKKAMLCARSQFKPDHLSDYIGGHDFFLTYEGKFTRTRNIIPLEHHISMQNHTFFNTP